MWFDNHCHLTSIGDDPGEVVAAAAAAGVTKLLTVGCSVADSRDAVDIASKFENVWATVGVHPHEAAGLQEASGGDNPDDIEALKVLLSADKVVAVGECGLDYFYDYSPRQAQAEVFAQQIQLAHDFGLALVIHSRDAWDDTFKVLDECGIPERTVFHCFTGGPKEAESAAERDIYVSFSGILTFPSATGLREAAKSVALDRVLVETDSPYLAPAPHRGNPNKPAHVSVVGEYLADCLGLPAAELAAQTTANAHTMYGIPVGA